MVFAIAEHAEGWGRWRDREGQNLKKKKTNIKVHLWQISENVIHNTRTVLTVGSNLVGKDRKDYFEKMMRSEGRLGVK